MIFDQQPPSRQELWERIRKTSKDLVVLEEMLRHGFWAAGAPSDPGDEVARTAELRKQRGTLASELHGVQAQRGRTLSEEAIKKELRERRMAEARRRRQETKDRRERERQERAEAWSRRKATEIVYLGRGVSGGLSELQADEVRLRERGLPVFHTPAELAQAMGVSVGQLRFLAFERRTARSSHYVTFRLPKKSGGERLISAPMERLKAAQRWVLVNLLEKVPVHAACHGFQAGRSIVTNARPHVGARVVVNADVKDFFPSFFYGRVKGMFRWLGYSEAVATMLALLCTAAATTEVELDGVTYHVASGRRALPQGAPTSPAISNILCDRLDRRLTKAATDLGFVYTRYADDLTFSVGPAAQDAAVGKLLRRVRWLVAKDGLVLHPDKTRVLRPGRRQEVTGVVVNRRLGVPRDVLRRFRATLFQIEKDGPAGKRWGQSGNLLAAIRGFADYVHMVDPIKGAPLRGRVDAIVRRFGGPPPAAPTPPGEGPPTPPGEGPPAGEGPAQGEQRPWWRVF